MGTGLLIFGLITTLIGSILGVHNAMQTNRTNREIQESVNASNEAINQRQLNHADQAASEADERTRALFSDLYSPEAKMEMYKKAGLNPALMYGANGASGVSTAGAQASTPNALPMQGVKMDRLLGLTNTSDINNAINTAAQTKLLEAKTKNELADLPLKERQAEAITQGIKESEKRIQEIDQQIKESIAKITNIEHQNELLEAQRKYEEAKTNLANCDLLTRGEFNRETINNLKAQTEKFEKEAKEAAALARKYNADANLIEKSTELQIEKLQYEIIQTIASANELNAMTRKLDSETWLNTLEAKPQQALQDLLDQYGGENGEGTAKGRLIAEAIKILLDLYGKVNRVVKKVK